MLSTTSGFRRTVPVLVGFSLLAGALVGCASGGTPEGGAGDEQNSAAEPAPSTIDEVEKTQPESLAQEETCDWDAPRLSAPADVPTGQEGDLPEVLVGSWQHTHTDEGSGFEEVKNDHRYVFSSAERMLYCQHVPGATDHDENAADVVLNGSAIELSGGKYAYTVTAWDDDTLVWDNPVGGGYVYLLQRR